MNRRRMLSSVCGVVAATAISGRNAFAAQGTPEATPAGPSPEDERFMRMALEEARLGLRQGNFPFGAVIVREGEVLARAHNTGYQDGDPTAHGEMNAIHAFLAEHGSAALKGTTLYTTGEPCVMCTGAIIWCGIGRIVYAASVAELATKLDQIMLTSAEIVARETFAPVQITGGVLSDEALELFTGDGE